MRWRADGTRVSSAVSGYGPGTGRATLQVPEDGLYVLNVSASGAWTIDIAGQDTMSDHRP